MIEKLRLKKKDILIKPKNKNDIGTSSIVLIDDERQTDDLNFFEVLKVAPDVVDVSAGDIILLKMGDHTESFFLDNMRVAITEEEKVEAVVEL